MSKSNALLFHQWKVIPVAILFIMWTLYGLHRQYTEGPDQLDKTQAKIDEHSIYVTQVIDAPSSPEAPLPMPPEEQTTTLLKEAGKGQHVDTSLETSIGLTPATLIVYAYSESPNARENLLYFLKKGIHGMADFMFIFNGETDAEILLPNITNVKFVKRENKCYDLGTMGEVLAKDKLWKGYKRFITLNASIRGPFLPTYSSSSCWSDCFLSRITDNVKLVGTTMNCQPFPHVQSMLLATDSIGMGILLNPSLANSVSHNDFFGAPDDPTGFTPCYTAMRQAIHGELGLTELIRSQGYEVDVLLTAFQAHTPTTYCEKNGNPEDILYEGKYFGSNVHPYELVFIKANRNIDPRLLEVMTVWHLGLNGSAWDTCGGKREVKSSLLV